MKAVLALALAATSSQAQPASADDLPVTVFAAGSLRAALTRIATDYEALPGARKVKLMFGASGLLRDRLAGGEQADVFASANMEHPQSLAAAGRAEPARTFARNALCALASPAFSLQGQTLAQRLLDADVRVGTSTPKADPSGDYAFEMFDRIEQTAAAPAGSAAKLKEKALQLTGGPASPPPPADRNVYGMLVADGKADVFITYCTNATQARQEVPALQILPIAPDINVAARYGVTLLNGAGAPARAFVEHLLGTAGQQRLASFGFSQPN